MSAGRHQQFQARGSRYCVVGSTARSLQKNRRDNMLVIPAILPPEMVFPHGYPNALLCLLLL